MPKPPLAKLHRFWKQVGDVHPRLAKSAVLYVRVPRRQENHVGIASSRNPEDMTELAQTVYRHLFTPNVDMCYMQLTIIESPHFYEFMQADDAYKPRLFSVYVDVHKEFEQGMFFAMDQYGRFFIEHFRSTDDPQYVLDNRCPKFHFLSIVCDNGVFHPDHLPCPSGGPDADAHEQWMDFLANIRKFYDDVNLRANNRNFYLGLYKELPPGGTVTQVLCASVPRAVAYFDLLDSVPAHYNFTFLA